MSKQPVSRYSRAEASPNEPKPLLRERPQRHEPAKAGRAHEGDADPAHPRGQSLPPARAAPPRPRVINERPGPLRSTHGGPPKPSRRRRSASSRSPSDWEEGGSVPCDGGQDDMIAPDFVLTPAGRAVQLQQQNTGARLYRRDHFFDPAKLDTAQLPLLSIRYLDQSRADMRDYVRARVRYETHRQLRATKEHRQVIWDCFKRHQREKRRKISKADKPLTKAALQDFAHSHRKSLCDGCRRLVMALFPWLDNYCMQGAEFEFLCSAVGWRPGCDMCCDVLGSNALAPLYYSVRENSFRQMRMAAGRYLIANIIFDQFDRWIDLLEGIFLLDPATRILLICDDRKGLRGRVLRNGLWQVAAYWPPGCKLWTATSKSDPFDFAARRPPNGISYGTFAFQIAYAGCPPRDLRRQLAEIDARYRRYGVGPAHLDEAGKTAASTPSSAAAAAYPRK